MASRRRTRRHAPGHQPGGTDPWFAPSLESWGLRFGSRRSLRSSAGSQERDQQGWPEQVADVLDGIAESEIAGLDDVHDMDDGRPDAKDGGRDDVASRKPSRRPMATTPRMPTARLATPTSSWKGLPVGRLLRIDPDGEQVEVVANTGGGRSASSC
jgi:hypothetical protein